MERISGDLYGQTYYSEDFFMLLDVQDDESIRLKRMQVDVLCYEISVLHQEDTLLFFLHLYFQPNPTRPLTYKELFGNIKY